MSWNINRYPRALRRFSRVMRRRAIVIANGLLQQHYSETRALALAIAIVHSEGIKSQRGIGRYQIEMG